MTTSGETSEAGFHWSPDGEFRFREHTWEDRIFRVKDFEGRVKVKEPTQTPAARWQSEKKPCARSTKTLLRASTTSGDFTEFKATTTKPEAVPEMECMHEQYDYND